MVFTLKNTEAKKELQTQYKEREIIGGVFQIRNTQNNKLLLDAAVNLYGSKNRFEFAKKTELCVHKKLQNDWTEQGSSIFVFEILEELKKGDTQTDADFKSDINLLREIWLEKLSNNDFY